MRARLFSMLALPGLVWASGCMARASSVPMAGHRNPSTACVLGLRGVRVALDDAPSDAIDVRLTMCSDVVTLRQRVRRFLDTQGPAADSATPQDGVREIELAQQQATAHVEDISGGVRIRIVPGVHSDPDVIRDEVEARVARLSGDKRCD